MKTRTLIITTILSTGLVLGLNPYAQADPIDHEVVRSIGGGNVVRSSNGNCVRTKWMSEGNVCRVESSEIINPSKINIADEDRTLYFGFNKTNLVASENRKLDSLAETLKSKSDISGVTIVGYADRIGTASDNVKLSKKRAEVVEKSLRDRGYLKTNVAKTRWLGESAANTQCSNELKRGALITCLQTDRKVTVEIQYKDRDAYSYNF